jgi:hypothetical protein
MDIKIKKAFPYCQRSFGFKETFELYHDEKIGYVNYFTAA